eukprot:2899787-Rhodomonas_salina.4
MESVPGDGSSVGWMKAVLDGSKTGTLQREIEYENPRPQYKLRCTKWALWFEFGLKAEFEGRIHWRPAALQCYLSTACKYYRYYVSQYYRPTLACYALPQSCTVSWYTFRRTDLAGWGLTEIPRGNMGSVASFRGANTLCSANTALQRDNAAIRGIAAAISGIVAAAISGIVAAAISGIVAAISGIAAAISGVDGAIFSVSVLLSHCVTAAIYGVNSAIPGSAASIFGGAAHICDVFCGGVL